MDIFSIPEERTTPAGRSRAPSRRLVPAFAWSMLVVVPRMEGLSAGLPTWWKNNQLLFPWPCWLYQTFTVASR